MNQKTKNECGSSIIELLEKLIEEMKEEGDSPTICDDTPPIDDVPVFIVVDLQEEGSQT